MRDFHDLVVWRRAHQLTLHLYKLTRSFPAEERYGLTSQIRRASASIGANLAEGCGRRSDAEMGRFALMAMGSASELDYHLLLARDLGLMHSNEYSSASGELSEIRRMLTALTLKIRAGQQSSRAKS